jgi:biotin transporter BioY
MNRQDVVTEFKTNEDIQVFLISIKAGGVGLNLTEADYVFILDPWWNPAVEQQAIDRTHRIGQKNTVFIYKFITKNSVEEKILAQVYIPIGIDRIAIQVVVVILSGLISGPMVGLTAQLLYLMLFVFTPNTLNDTYFFTAFKDASIGYQLSFPVVAFVAGYLGNESPLWKIALGCIAAYTCYFIIGILINSLKTDVSIARYFNPKFNRIIILGFAKALITSLIYFGYLGIRKWKIENGNLKMENRK